MAVEIDLDLLNELLDNQKLLDKEPLFDTESIFDDKQILQEKSIFDDFSENDGAMTFGDQSFANDPLSFGDQSFDISNHQDPFDVMDFHANKNMSLHFDDDLFQEKSRNLSSIVIPVVVEIIVLSWGYMFFS